MKLRNYIFLGMVGFLAVSCHKTANKEDPVISQRFVHKYGYALTQNEWESNQYPGQVITSLRNGVTITTTYENGVPHGACTHTFPNSQTIETYFLYNQGEKVKEIHYDLQGMPTNEALQVSPTRLTKTKWFNDGTPMNIEEYSNDELLDGQYFTLNNETEARVEKGNGLRFCRNREGVLQSKDEFLSGYMVKRETFHPNGTPESIVFYKKGKLHGEKKTFAATGEPLSTEEWVMGKLNGKCTYYINGAKEIEVSYLNGLKHGPEIHYVDGETVLQETEWEFDKKHGPTTYYVDGIAKTQWFYDGVEVSSRKYQEQLRLDEMASQISPDLQVVE